MTDRFRIALAQLNPVMGDIAGNLARARAARAQAAGADVILFSELFIVGYSPEDLVLKPALQADARAAVEELARDTADGGPAMLIGTPWVEDGKLYNAVRAAGRRQGRRRRPSSATCPITACSTRSASSPPGPLPGPFDVRGVRIGVPICEDIWTPDVVACLAETGARNSAACPTARPSRPARKMCASSLAAARVKETGLPLVYLNQLGGQDEVVFDGASLRAECRWRARRGAAGLGRAGRRSPTGSATRTASGSARRASSARPKTAAVPGLSRHDAGPARLCEQEPLSRRGAGAVRRHRFRAVGGGGGGCAGRGPRALRDAAVALYLAAKAWKMPMPAPGCWACAYETIEIEARRGGDGRDAGAAPSPARRPTPRKRISSRACAA